jgi:hypothetical protein
MIPFPPLGSARIFPQTVHITFVEGFPKITWSFLHFEQHTFMNLLVGSLINSVILWFFSYFSL